MLIDKQYIITGSDAFHDEATASSLKEAREIRKKLQKIEDDEATDDLPPGTVEIYRLERVS